jgi:ubiquinone/menaquinone biosynthesis C-methylase UbiE
MAAVYDRGRAVPSEALGGWRDAVAPFVGSAPPVLDLGAGTGLWAAAFVEWFAVDVIAVEPSEAMRAEAVRKRTHERVAYLGGRAEQIPIRDSSCSCAWLSTVVHHIDMTAAARDLRRVLAPGAAVLIRNAFAGRCDGVTWLRYWPHARSLAERRWPTIEAVAKTFGGVGFKVEIIETVAQQTAPSLSDYRERLRTRADSTLAELGDEDFLTGMKSLDAAVAAEDEPRPVIDRLDLVVLR